MDDTLAQLLEFSRKARNFCAEFVATSMEKGRGRTINELFLAPVMIVSRMIRHHDAIELLIREGFAAEATIIGLTQFELCLDVLFMSDDVFRATQWLQHDSERKSPWSVRHKIDHVYCSDSEVRDANLEYFQLLSAIKHGNPLASVFGFSTRFIGNRVSIANDRIDDRFSRAYAIAVIGLCTYRLIESLEGVARAFGKFDLLDPNLDLQRKDFLEACRHRIGEAMQSVGLIKAPTLH